MSMLRHTEYTSETRESYLRGELPQDQMDVMRAIEDFVLTISENGFGKRTSSYEYRVTGRGGQGIANIDLTEKTGLVVESFPVAATDEIMLVTDAGKLIRIPVEGVRIVGRRTQGVTLLRTAENERVVSVARLADVGTNEDESETNEDETAGDQVADESDDTGSEDDA
jgi:DNA gyrase subunit A